MRTEKDGYSRYAMAANARKGVTFEVRACRDIKIALTSEGPADILIIPYVVIIGAAGNSKTIVMRTVSCTLKIIFCIFILLYIYN